MDYIEIIHSNSSITSLDDFIDFHIIKNISSGELLNYENNSELIYNSYLPEDRINYPSATTELIRVPTKIKVPIENVEREVILTQNNLVFDNFYFDCFYDEYVSRIINDRGYIPFLNREDEFYLQRIDEGCSVYIFCKSLGNYGKLLNLTPFIQDLNINNVKNTGGNFSFSLPFITAVNKDNEISIDNDVIDLFFDDTTLSYLARINLLNLKGDNYYLNKSFFHNVISENDVVFIRFEPLKIEGKNNDELNNIIIDPSFIPNKIWDMIGLVDVNQLTQDSSTSNININITGRDLIKVLIDDGTYFYPLDAATNASDYFDNNEGLSVRGQRYNRPLQRLITGELNFFNAYLDRTIDFSLKFIMNLLSNIEVCNDYLFSSYKKDEITYRYEFYTPDSEVNSDDIDDYPPDAQQKIRERKNRSEEQRKREYQKIPAPGIWKIIKLAIDPIISNRRIADTSISTDQGSLLNFVNKVIQEPFAEFYSDTYGDKFFFIARKPPFDSSGFNSNFILDIHESDIYSRQLQFDDEVYSWYRLIPKGNFFGDTDNLSLYYLPAYYFEEYAKIWGSRPLEVVSNYLDYEGLKGSNGKINLENLKEQAIQDLAFVIESNAYKPFTKKGIITIKGDRRIKVGMNVRLIGTGEIYHVDSVNNYYNVSDTFVDRITTLNVSRGMVEKHTHPNEKFSYFNIIKLERDNTGKVKNSNFRLNNDVFDFFIKRKQFL